jgi:hypothetical protein
MDLYTADFYSVSRSRSFRPPELLIPTGLFEAETTTSVSAEVFLEEAAKNVYTRQLSCLRGTYREYFHPGRTLQLYRFQVETVTWALILRAIIGR